MVGVHLLPDDKILLVVNSNSRDRTLLIRLLRDGTPDATFGPGGVPGAPSVRTADADDQIIGVFKYDAALGETVGILSGGQCSVIAGAAITAGQGVVANATGRAVPAGAGVKGYGTAYTDGGAGDAVYIHFS